MITGKQFQIDRAKLHTFNVSRKLVTIRCFVKKNRFKIDTEFQTISYEASIYFIVTVYTFL